MKVLVTGGAGFIGSTIASACLDAGLVPVVLDDLSAGRREFTAGRIAYEGAITDTAVLDRILDEHPDIAAVVHCAARIVVPESVAQPVAYYDNNVVGTLRLVQQLLRRGCTRLLLSELVEAFRGVVGELKVEDGPRRPGDVVGAYARSATAERLLGWRAERSLEDGVRDALAWSARRPQVLGG